MNLGLQGKVVLVGASSKGLGYGIAEALLKEGASVAIGSRSRDHVDVALATLRAVAPGKVWGAVFDASKPESIVQWAQAARTALGPIYGLVVNAGGPPPGGFESFDDAGWDAAYQLTLMSSVRMIRAVLADMKAAGLGAILTVTSSSVKEPIEHLLLSNVFRSGVASLVKSLSREFAPHGIRINNLIPGRIDTERVRSLDNAAASRLGQSLEQCQTRERAAIPLGRYGTIQEFGVAATFLLSSSASYITGSSLVVDGGKLHATS